MLEDSPAAARSAPSLRELARKGFDRIEYSRDLPLVARQDHAFRKRVADDQNPLRRQSLEIDRTTGWALLVALRAQLDRRGLFPLWPKPPRALPAEGPQQVPFLRRAQPGHHRHAIAEQRCDAPTCAEG